MCLTGAAGLATAMAVEDAMRCVICMSERKSVMLMPCNHVCVCAGCLELQLEHFGTCPLCMTSIQDHITNVFI